MDPSGSLAASVVAVLSPYLAKAGEEFAKVAGAAAANKFGALYQFLKTRFKKKPAAKEALVDLEANPENEDAKAALRRQLTKQMDADNTFIETLQKLLDEIDQDKESHTFLTQVYGGEVDQIINAHHIETINYKKDSKPG